MSDTSALVPLVQQYFEKDPAGAAASLETMSEEAVAEALRVLPASLAARAVRQLQVGYAAAVLKDAPTELFQELVEGLDPQHASAIFMHLPRESRERFLEHLPGKLQRAIQEHLTYPENSVGRMMTTRFLAFRQSLRVKEAIQRIRELAARFPASYAYVLDPEDHLIGVMNMRDVLLADPDQPLESVMRRDVLALPCFMDREEAAQVISRRRYFAAPVVDAERHQLGVISAEQLIHGAQEEVAEDLQRMVGAGGDEHAFSSLGYALRKRLPWLHVNLATAFLAASVVALFQDVIARITVLAVFLPVVAGQGGNAGAQSLAIVMRGLVMREIPRARVKRLVFKETLLGTISGLSTGVITGLVAWAWHGNPWLGLVVAIAMVVNLFAAGLSGASIPLVMKALGLDPAQCSSIIQTTVTDVVGFFAFLGLALVFEGYLV